MKAISSSEMEEPHYNPALGIFIRVNGKDWTVTPDLLPDDFSNPLVAPAALINRHRGVFMYWTRVLEPDQENQFRCIENQEAAIYCFNLDEGRIIRVSESGEMVNPAGMVMNAGTLFITEPGIVPFDDEDKHLALWRARRHEFAVTAHFRGPQMNFDVIKRVLSDIRYLSIVRSRRTRLAGYFP